MEPTTTNPNHDPSLSNLSQLRTGSSQSQVTSPGKITTRNFNRNWDRALVNLKHVSESHVQDPQKESRDINGNIVIGSLRIKKGKVGYQTIPCQVATLSTSVTTLFSSSDSSGDHTSNETQIIPRPEPSPLSRRVEMLENIKSVSSESHLNQLLQPTISNHETLPSPTISSTKTSPIYPISSFDQVYGDLGSITTSVSVNTEGGDPINPFRSHQQSSEESPFEDLINLNDRIPEPSTSIDSPYPNPTPESPFITSNLMDSSPEESNLDLTAFTSSSSDVHDELNKAKLNPLIHPNLYHNEQEIFYQIDPSSAQRSLNSALSFQGVEPILKSPYELESKLYHHKTSQLNQKENELEENEQEEENELKETKEEEENELKEIKEEEESEMEEIEEEEEKELKEIEEEPNDSIINLENRKSLNSNFNKLLPSPSLLTHKLPPPPNFPPSLPMTRCSAERGEEEDERESPLPSPTDNLSFTSSFEEGTVELVTFRHPPLGSNIRGRVYHTKFNSISDPEVFHRSDEIMTSSVRDGRSLDALVDGSGDTKEIDATAIEYKNETKEVDHSSPSTGYGNEPSPKFSMAPLSESSPRSTQSVYSDILDQPQDGSELEYRSSSYYQKSPSSIYSVTSCHPPPSTEVSEGNPNELLVSTDETVIYRPPKPTTIRPNSEVRLTPSPITSNPSRSPNELEVISNLLPHPPPTTTDYPRSITSDRAITQEITHSSFETTQPSERVINSVYRNDAEQKLMNFKLQSTYSHHQSKPSTSKFSPRTLSFLRRTHSEKEMKPSPIREESEVDDKFDEYFIFTANPKPCPPTSDRGITMIPSLDTALDGLTTQKHRRNRSLLPSKFTKPTLPKVPSLPMKRTSSSTKSKPSLFQRLRHLVTGQSSLTTPRLHQFDTNRVSCLIAIGSTMSATYLGSKFTYVLECDEVIYLWFGNKATEGQQKEAACFSGNLIAAYDDTPVRPPIKVEFEGSEHHDFIQQFSDWNVMESTRSYTRELTKRSIPGKEQLEETFHVPESEPLTNLDDITFVSLKIWIMKAGQEHAELPRDEHGIFYSEESYVMMYHYQDSYRANRYVIFYWLGRDSTRSKETIFPPNTVQLDELNHAVTFQILQGHEPLAFMNLFPHSFIVKWGARQSRLQHTLSDRVMYSVRGDKNQSVYCEQTTMRCRYLCSGRCFVLVMKSDIYVWNGAGSYLFERLAGLKIANRLATSHQIIEISEKSEPRKFWSGLGERTPYADMLGWAKKPLLPEEYQPRLFHITAAPKINLREIRPFHQRDLDSYGIYLLDTYFECYLWNPLSSKLNPLLVQSIYLALEYTRLANLTTPPRPFQLLPSVIAPHHEPPEFIAAFPSWSPTTPKPTTFKPTTLHRLITDPTPATHLLSQWNISPSPPSRSNSLLKASLVN